MIQILSDTHFHFHISPKVSFKPSKLKPLRNIFTEADTLIIAGDIGAYMSQNIDILNYLKQTYYNNIAIVFGNHDYWVSHKKIHNYRVWEQVTKKIYKDNNIIVLDGDTITLDNRKIFGYPSWYDDNYLKEFDSTVTGLYEIYWQHSMNDSIYIKGLKSSEEMFHYQQSKLKNLSPVDILVCHVRPYVSNNHVLEGKSSLLNTFYMFDGSSLLGTLKPQYCIHGHQHHYYNYHRNSINYICNPLGYPQEKLKPPRILI